MPVNCILWNCDGIERKQQELSAYLQSMQIEIVCLTETRLGKHGKLRIQNYKVEEKRRNNAHGGVAVLVRTDVIYERIATGHPALSDIEAIAIRLSDNTVVVAYYNSPQVKLQSKQLDALFGISRKVIVVGDFNATHATWGCHRNNVNGNMLNGYVKNSDVMLLHTADPTHFPDNGTTPTTVDLILTKNVGSINNISTDTLPSNHAGVLFTIGDVSGSRYQRVFWDYGKANWALFRLILGEEGMCYKIHSIEDLEGATTKFTASIVEATNRAVPKKTVDLTKFGELPAEILSEIQERNRMRRRYQASRDPELLRGVKNLNISIRAKISEHRNNTFATRLGQLSHKDGSVWRLNKYLRRSYHTITSMTDERGEMLRSNTDMAEDFAETFQKYYHVPSTDVDAEDEVRKKVAEFFLSQPVDPKNSHGYTTSPGAVKKYITRSPSMKAPGIDGIQNIVLKNLPRKSVVQLTHIINGMIRLQQFPEQWKRAEVTPVPKPGKDLTKSAGYRPISLLPTISKIAERVLLQHIDEHLEENRILPNHQFGFRAAHSAVQQVARVVNDTITAFNKRQYTALMLVDLEKAFDRVWIDGLLYKMIQLDFPAALIHTIKSYLLKRTFSVRINDALSNARAVTAGVPQGSVLGPVLFSIFTYDIPEFPNTKLATYADDTLIYAHSFSPTTALQKIGNHLSRYESYLKKWKMAANPTKSSVIVLTRKTQPMRIPWTPVFQRQNLPLVSTTKYLGCPLDTRLRFKPFIENNASKTMAVLRKLQYVLLHRNTSMEVKILIFKAVLRPILVYGAPIWSMAAKYLIRKLQVVQNKCLRIILGARRRTPVQTLHENTGIDLLNEYVQQIAEKFYERTESSDNLLIKNITRIRNTENVHRLLHQHLEIFNTGMTW